MRNIVFNIGAHATSALTRICRIVGVILSIKGIGVKIKIVGIGRFEF